MTPRPLPAARLIVVGVDGVGAEVARLALGHGDDPTGLLASRGWQVRRVRDVVTHPVGKSALTMTFEVEPADADPRPLVPVVPVEQQIPGDHPLAGEAVQHQRVAAYALVTSSRGVLMTQFSDRTSAQGQWGLPGGGLDPDEPPEQAVVREAWEESGQVIEVSDLELIQSNHWIGRSPSGQLEDFHAVRIVYRAVCHDPTDPVVHDVGGTTESAAWLLPADLDRLGLTSAWRSILRDMAPPDGRGTGVSRVIMAPDKTDSADDHHHDADADDPARPEP